MSEIRLVPMERLGFDFSESKDLRELPFNTKEADWRYLDAEEISTLQQGGSTADNWANIQVLEGFNPHLVADCRFYGKVRIGRLSESFIEYHDLRLPVGIYNSTVVSCDIGNDTALHNVGYMSHVVVEERCILFNINELITTDHAKFGNGVIIDGEDEDVRIWLEIANENGGRKVLPFDGLLPADAWIWSKYRDDKELMKRFVELTGKVRDSRRGRYGRIGKETVIKDCRVLKDVKIGERAYIKGCNKLKNLTINSDEARPTQLGEGSELVNGIIGYGCRVFYGVKAVRFILNDHSNLKYGARLINSILGSNSTISCCEVLNSLIFGSHEQHHNSSFLCASTMKGQTNMASAATVGSNHNSRSSDGEIVADRGFWPGLSVSLKHNSRFASFCLIAKGAYPAELDIPLPFTLVSNSESTGELLLMPGYWFRYNMYALTRNAAKTAVRDKRLVKHQELEFDWLAPDTVDQMRAARLILEDWADEMYPSGRSLLETEESPELFAGESYKVEATRRPVRILHAGRAWRDYGRMIRYYAVRTLAGGQQVSDSAGEVGETGPWENVGGQMILRSDLESLKGRIRTGEIDSWPDVHRAYREIGSTYELKKRAHAEMVLKEFSGRAAEVNKKEALETASFILEGIRNSRKKDYVNHFRNITFESDAERDAVVGAFDENKFILEAEKEFEAVGKLIQV
ncbi:MAG: DUF4954 domain-containing protein [Spirochaetes bacterium]|nr:MAG: DUF4954 domain-containing protein [Spirochaetota bacterium]